MTATATTATQQQQLQQKQCKRKAWEKFPHKSLFNFCCWFSTCRWVSLPRSFSLSRSRSLFICLCFCFFFGFLLFFYCSCLWISAEIQVAQISFRLVHGFPLRFPSDNFNTIALSKELREWELERERERDNWDNATITSTCSTHTTRYYRKIPYRVVYQWKKPPQIGAMPRQVSQVKRIFRARVSLAVRADCQLVSYTLIYPLIIEDIHIPSMAVSSQAREWSRD